MDMRWLTSAQAGDSAMPRHPRVSQLIRTPVAIAATNPLRPHGAPRLYLASTSPHGERRRVGLGLPMERGACIAMSWRNAIAGASCLCESGAPVMGDVELVRSHLSIAVRSNACPSAVVTGSRITSPVIGQRN